MINSNSSRFGSGPGTGPVIDMTPDGKFVTPPRAQPARHTPTFGTIIARVVGFGVLLGVAAVTFWAALFIVPALILLGVAGYAVTRLFGGGNAGRGLRRF